MATGKDRVVALDGNTYVASLVLLAVWFSFVLACRCVVLLYLDLVRFGFDLLSGGVSFGQF